MEVIAFKDNCELIDEFIDFGNRIYAGDVNFIPPGGDHLSHLVGDSSLASQAAGNDILHLLARGNGRTTGRISAFVNRNLCDRDGTRVGCLGNFECIDDYNTARTLLDHAIGWLVERHGLHRIWGPMNFDIWHGYRFKTAGFEEIPFIGEPYNRVYYPEIFLKYGFSIKAEWDSLRVTGRERVSQMIKRGKDRYRLLQDRGYRFENILPSRLESDLPKLHQVLSASFAGFLGYTEISLPEFAALFAESSKAFDPDLSMIAYDEQGRVGGFAIAYPELAEAVLAMRGKTGVLPNLKFAYHRYRCKTANFYIGGVTPDEISRRSGLGRAGFYYIIEKALDKGYDTILLTLRLKGNFAHGLAARSGCVPQCEYALYEWNHE